MIASLWRFAAAPALAFYGVIAGAAPGLPIRPVEVMLRQVVSKQFVLRKRVSPRAGRPVRRLGLGLLLAALALGSAGCQSYREGSSRTVGQFTDDTGIQSRLKTALIRDAEISGLRINTEVNRGVVTLHGRVRSEAERARVLALAAAIKGVERVDDRLSIVPE